MTSLLTTLWYRLTGQPEWKLRQLEQQRQYASYYRLSQLIGWQALSPFYGGEMRLISDQLLRVLERGELAPDFHYRHFTRPKEDGSPRKLAEPDPTLKRFQHNIRKFMLKRAAAHPAALGFRRRRSTADHAWQHAGAHTIVTADITDFFPSTKAWRVEAWWQTQFPDQEDAARLYTLLTTYQGALPQGAPTSPDLSNMVNLDMDTALESRAKISGGRYSRYCDDLAFSWSGRDDMPSDFEAGIRSSMGEYGYHLHDWQVWQGSDEPELTGIILKRRGGVALPETVRQTIRQLERSHDPGDAARLAGYRSYENMVLGLPERRERQKEAQRQKALERKSRR